MNLEDVHAVSHWELPRGSRSPLGRLLPLPEANQNSCFLSELRAVIATYPLIAVKPNGQPRMESYPKYLPSKYFDAFPHFTFTTVTQQVLPFQKGSANASSPSLILVSMHLIDGSPLGKQRQQIQVNGPKDWEAMAKHVNAAKPEHSHLQ